MANSIALVTKFLPLLDAIFEQESKTARLDAPAGLVMPTMDANTIKIAKLAMQGLVGYSKSSGFTGGDVTLTWQTHTFTQDRGRTFTVDAMDDMETLGVVMGNLFGEFMRTKVIPELDAYRISKYAGTTGITSAAAALTSSTIIAAIDTATGVLDNASVPEDGRLLYMTPDSYQLLKQANDTKHVLVPGQSEDRNFMMYDGMEIVKVPASRMYSKITLATSGAGGYSKDSTNGKDINFMIVHPSAVLQVKKHAKPRMFDPDVNQTADAWKVDYRLYHDAFVYENKAKGIYVHTKA